MKAPVCQIKKTKLKTKNKKTILNLNTNLADISQTHTA